MRLQEILRTKGHSVHTTSPDATLASAIAKLVECNVGSLMVYDGDRMAGIITERDILRACAAHQRPLDQLLVRTHMSTKLVTGTPDDKVEEVMGLMTSRRIRHLPIISEDRLVGIISIGDVVKAQFDKLAVENHYLKTYIHGSA